MTESTQNDRTHFEAVFDIKYGIQFNDLNSRFYRRIDSAFSVINVLGGSAVFIGLFKQMPITSAAIGLFIAILSYIDREIKPIEKAIKCERQKKKFGKLFAKTDTMTLQDIDKELRLLQSHSPLTIDSLAMPAFIKTMNSNGFDSSYLKLNPLQKLYSWIA